MTNDNTDNKARVIDMAPLHRVSKLLGVESGELLESLTSNSVVTRYTDQFCLNLPIT